MIDQKEQGPLDELRTQRYRRHDLIDWFSQEQVAATSIAVIGAGAVGNEVVKNLALLGVGEIDLFDFDVVERHNLTRSVLLREADVGRDKAEAVAERARELDPHVTVRSIAGDFWDTLSLGRLARYDCAIAAVDNLEARLKLNQMCQIAGVDLVNAGLDSRWVTVESFPFGSTPGVACYECTLPDTAYARVAERYSCGGLRRRAQLERRIPTTVVTASIAGALAASTALRFGSGRRTGALAPRADRHDQRREQRRRDRPARRLPGLRRVRGSAACSAHAQLLGAAQRVRRRRVRWASFRCGSATR